MVFKAERTADIPNQDLISWIFDTDFDQDEPVSHISTLTAGSCSF